MMDVAHRAALFAKPPSVIGARISGWVVKPPQSQCPIPYNHLMSDESEDPWYKDGLRFECTQCGKCCTGAPGYVWVNDEEIAAIAQRLSLSVTEFTQRYTYEASRGKSLVERPNGDCIFWAKDQGCTIYDIRPRQCRTWPFWESNVDSPADWRHTCRICPGSGKGDLISADEITRRLKVIRL